MASSKDYLDFILEQLSELDDITYRAMMGEYIIYYRGKVVGGIYDDRFLVKPVKSAEKMMPEAGLELPYEGAKEMLLVDNVENKAFLRDLLEAMYEEIERQKVLQKLRESAVYLHDPSLDPKNIEPERLEKILSTLRVDDTKDIMEWEMTHHCEC
jgi:TfoX/Sxy family transcriptional regulator of competence genes